jgi:hypothetical protein
MIVGVFFNISAHAVLLVVIVVHILVIIVVHLLRTVIIIVRHVLICHAHSFR